MKKLFLPYVKGVSERIEKACRQLNIQTVFKSNGTLRQALMRVKSQRPEELRRGVVYEVPCSECNMKYIGETGRSLQERLKEHKYAVKTANMNNGIAAHAWNHQHRVDWDSARAKTFEQHLWKRKVLEAICIRETREQQLRLWTEYKPSMVPTTALASSHLHIMHAISPPPSIYRSSLLTSPPASQIIHHTPYTIHQYTIHIHHTPLFNTTFQNFDHMLPSSDLFMLISVMYLLSCGFLFSQLFTS